MTEYTKEELTVYAHGMKALARAVCKQWIKDGAPERDLPGIRPWLKLLVDTSYDVPDVEVDIKQVLIP